MLGSRIKCSCPQISLAMSLNAGNVIVSCILDQSEFLRVPSIVYSSDTDWSNWRALSAYSTDSEEGVCNDGVKVRSRKCISCSESHSPWCIAQIPQPLERCISFHAIKYSAILNDGFSNTSEEAANPDPSKRFQMHNGLNSASRYVHYKCDLSGCSSTIENTRTNITKTPAMDFESQRCQPVDFNPENKS